MKVNGKYKYAVNADNAVEVWEVDAVDGDAPFLRQPLNPDNGKVFETAQEAEDWADSYFTYIQSEQYLIDLQKLNNPELLPVQGDTPAPTV